MCLHQGGSWKSGLSCEREWKRRLDRSKESEFVIGSVREGGYRLEITTFAGLDEVARAMATHIEVSDGSRDQ